MYLSVPVRVRVCVCVCLYAFVYDGVCSVCSVCDRMTVCLGVRLLVSVSAWLRPCV